MHALYCSWSLGTTSSDLDIMILVKEECWQHWTCSYNLCSEIRALDIQQLPQPRDSMHQPHKLAVTMYIHCSIPYSIPAITDTCSSIQLQFLIVADLVLISLSSIHQAAAIYIPLYYIIDLTLLITPFIVIISSKAMNN